MSEASAAPASAFSLLGGEPAVRALVDRFYDLMDLEPAYAALRAAHGSTLAQARRKLFWYLCGWLGGPDLYQQRFGNPRLRARHLPYAIGNAERDQWLACMVRAMAECEVDPTLAEKLKGAGYATGMIGKWHIGFKEGLRPHERGFDYHYGFLSGARTYLPGKTDNDPVIRNGEPVTTTDVHARQTYYELKSDEKPAPAEPQPK